MVHVGMRINRWLLAGLLLVAACIGAGAVIASISIYYHEDSSDAFCTQCHSMTLEAEDAYFKRSRHVSNSAGVRATCGKCHIPTHNWIINTYTRVKTGMRDAWSEMTHNFSNATAWEAHRIDLEGEVQALFRAQDGVTCRSCHDASAINPKSEAGRSSHAALREGGTTCIDCHTNLVHKPAVPVGAGAPAPSR